MAEKNVFLPDWGLIAIGALIAGGGFYFCLVGFGTLPPPSKINGPLWIALCVGAVFLSAGISTVIRGALGMKDNTADLPSAAPTWVKLIYWLNSIAATAGLASIGSWVAFGSGTRHFTESGPIGGPAGEGVGRTVFGIAAVLTWLLVVVLARSGARQIFGKHDGG